MSTLHWLVIPRVPVVTGVRLADVALVQHYVRGQTALKLMWWLLEREARPCAHVDSRPASIANTWKCHGCGAVFQRKASRP